MTKGEDRTTIDLAIILTKVEYIEHEVNEIRKKQDEKYATKEWVNNEYGQTKKLINGLLITFGSAIAAALAAFIIRGGIK